MEIALDPAPLGLCCRDGLAARGAQAFDLRGEPPGVARREEPACHEHVEARRDATRTTSGHTSTHAIASRRRDRYARRIEVRRAATSRAPGPRAATSRRRATRRPQQPGDGRTDRPRDATLPASEPIPGSDPFDALRPMSGERDGISMCSPARRSIRRRSKPAILAPRRNVAAQLVEPIPTIHEKTPDTRSPPTRATQNAVPTTSEIATLATPAQVARETRPRSPAKRTAAAFAAGARARAAREPPASSRRPPPASSMPATLRTPGHE